MKTPVLVIMAAGMGSRFGGLKQIEPVSDKGEIILDFSLYDAIMAGFKKVIFVIKEETIFASCISTSVSFSSLLIIIIIPTASELTIIVDRI